MAVIQSTNNRYIYPRNDAVTSGAISTLNGEVVLQLDDDGTNLYGGCATFALDVRGTFTGTFNPEGTIDGTNWVALPMHAQATQVFVTTLTAAGAWNGPCGGLKAVRLRCSAYTSGTATVTLRATMADDFVVAMPFPTTNWGTVTAATGVAATLSLPAPGVGLYHYITEIHIVKFATALLTAAATPVLVTTTNLTGAPIFSFSAGAELQGSSQTYQFEPKSPFKSTTANTATTIVCPATTGVIWRVNAAYYVGA